MVVHHSTIETKIWLEFMELCKVFTNSTIVTTIFWDCWHNQVGRFYHQVWSMVQ